MSLKKAELSTAKARFPKGLLKHIICDVTREFKINQSINESTIRNRIKRQNMCAYSSSHHSPIEGAEKHIAETIIQMSKINKPLSSSACIQLANSMIRGSTYQKRLREFKKI